MVYDPHPLWGQIGASDRGTVRARGTPGARGRARARVRARGRARTRDVAGARCRLRLRRRLRLRLGRGELQTQYIVARCGLFSHIVISTSLLGFYYASAIKLLRLTLKGERQCEAVFAIRPSGNSLAQA